MVYEVNGEVIVKVLKKARGTLALCLQINSIDASGLLAKTSLFFNVTCFNS
jgi:hypothetical protein